MNFTYNHFSPVQVLRTTYKAGPLLALGLACLAGGAVARLPGRWRPAAATGLAVLAAVAAWPLVSGRAIDPRLTFDEVPASWREAADHVDATAGEDGRAVVLPGQLYALLPLGRDDRRDPARARRAPRGGALRGALRGPARRRPALDHRRARPAAPRAARPARPAAGPARARARSSRPPTTTARLSGAVPPGEAADVLAQLGPPDERWGAVRPERRAAGTLGGPVPLPRVRAWDRADAPGAVRLEPDARRDRARRQRRRPRRPGGVRGAAARPADRLRGRPVGRRAAARRRRRRGRDLRLQPPARAGGRTDGPEPRRDAGRRRPVLARRGGARPVPASAAPTARPSRSTTAPARCGCRSRPPTRSSPSGGRSRPSTATPPRTGRPTARSSRRATGSRSASTPRATSTRSSCCRTPTGARRWRRSRSPGAPTTSGRAGTGSGSGCAACARCACGSPACAPRTTRPTGPAGSASCGSPGVQVREALRPPVLAERALAGRDLSRTGLTYLFERTTGDDPFRRDPRRGTAGAVLVRDRQDGERGLERAIAPPAARAWRAEGWGTVAAHAPDSAVDAAGGRAAARRSSPRADSRAARRSGPRAPSTARLGRGSAPGWTDAARGSGGPRRTGDGARVPPRAGARERAAADARAARRRRRGTPAVDVAPDGVGDAPGAAARARLPPRDPARGVPARAPPASSAQRRAVGIARDHRRRRPERDRAARRRRARALRRPRGHARRRARADARRRDRRGPRRRPPAALPRLRPGGRARRRTRALLDARRHVRAGPRAAALAGARGGPGAAPRPAACSTRARRAATRAPA